MVPSFVGVLKVWIAENRTVNCDFSNFRMNSETRNVYRKNILVALLHERHINHQRTLAIPQRSLLMFSKRIEMIILYPFKTHCA